jgi:hypothetical protein
VLPSPPSPPPPHHSAARMFAVICTCHSLIYPCSCRWETCSDAHAYAPSSVSTVALGCLARVYFLSLASLPQTLSFCSTRPHAPSTARRSMLDALNSALSPTLNTTRHQGGALRSQSCRAPPLPSCASLLLLLLLLHLHLPAGSASKVDLCGVFSHGHLGECVCCSVA